MPSISNDRQVRKEIPVSAKQWGGMISNVPSNIVPFNAFSLLLNMEFNGEFILKSRKGTVEYRGNAVTGSHEVISAIEYKRTDSLIVYIIEVLANGKVYSTQKGLGNTPVLLGTLDNTNITQVGMAQLKNAVYIADGLKGYKYDGTTLSSYQTNFPSIAPLTTGKIIDVVATRSQLWWIDSNDYLYHSVPNVPDDLTTTASGAGKIQIQFGDGATPKSLAVWGNTIIVNKIDTSREHHIMFWVRGLGTSTDPYRVDPLFGDPKSPTAFVGRSAAQVGGDIIGLTLGGVTTVSAINNFQEARPNSISTAIDDMIRRINFKESDKIHGIFDTTTRQYLLAVPIDGSTTVNRILVYDVDGDRWSIFDNWDVRCWVKSGSDILFGTSDGRLVKTKTGHNDEGAGFTKKLITGDMDYDAPDVVKLFKSCELKVIHFGNYSIYMTIAVDDIDVDVNRPIALPLTAGYASLWGTFIWGVDRWGSDGDSTRNVLLLARGKTLRYTLYNTEADQGFELHTLTTRLVVKDSGQAKAN